MESHSIKVQRATLLLLLFLLVPFAMAKQTVLDCCHQKSCSCHILELLHGTGNNAAGTLAFGKRSSATLTKTFQNRLYHLLNGSNNQAAGILTMGKRVTQLASEHKEDGRSTQLTPAPYAAEPDLARGCLAPHDKELPSGQKTDIADPIY